MDMEAARIVAASATMPRMLREMADALELFAATRPVVLICEDLHLSDRSTIELLSYLAQRRGAARLMIIATSRTAEMGPQARVLSEVVRELRGRHQCEELHLELLSETAVAEYLRRRIGSDAIPAGLAHRLYRRTEGNALFMATAVDHLLAGDADGNAAVSGNLERAGIADSVRPMIEKHLETLPIDDQGLLEAASVAGAEFSAAALSAALDCDDTSADRVEHQCKELARHTRFLDESGVTHWPDGTVAGRYRFHHALYQEVLYDRVSLARRIRLHRKIGERIEAGHGSRAGEIAAELAMHFERGGDHRRATTYLAASAETALHRSANDAAIAHAQKGLAVAAALPPGAERLAVELRLQLALGSALMARWGMAAPQVQRAYARAHELVRQIGETPALVPVLLGMAKFHIVRSELDAAEALAEPCLRLAQSADDADLLLESHVVMAAILYSRGRFREALAHSEKVIAGYDPRAHRLHALLYGIDPGVVARIYAAMSLWRLGCADQSRKRAGEAVALGEQLAHAHSLSMALSAHASTLQRCRLWPAAEAWADKLIRYAAEKELAFWHAWGEIFRGLAQAEQDDPAAGVMLVRSGLAALSATGGSSRQGEVTSLLVQVRAGAMQPEQALQVAEAALATILANGELTDEAELRRVIGVLKLRDRKRDPVATAEAEAGFLSAIETARRQGAIAFELRAVMDLARLWQSQGKRAEAREKLLENYGRFREGFDTGDLKEAQALIAELSQ